MSRVTRTKGLHVTLLYVFRYLFQGCILVLPKSLGRSSSSVGGAVTHYLVATGTEPLVTVLAWACSRVAGVVGAYPALYLRLTASSVHRRRSCSLSLMSEVHNLSSRTPRDALPPVPGVAEGCFRRRRCRDVSSCCRRSWGTTRGK